ncbi:MAG: glycosyltransferase family 4 protein [Planctomycetes bacterium]|nr:glycosyltransferase family 4 protein [Planctomycetota bacterium]MCP4860387.1 glycosyltransferase family 4 protein [Planctomycetota bacterium]
MTNAKRRLLFVLPCAVDDNRGNATSAIRIAESLSRRGYEIETVVADSASAAWPEFDLVLGFHAVDSGPVTQAIAKQREKPYVIAFTGTDLNGKPSAGAESAVAGASACVALCNSAARRARDIFNEMPGGVEVIFQAVAPLPYKPGLSLPSFAPELQPFQKLVLVPAGVRDIKDPLRAVKALTPLAALRPELSLWFVGPELEPACGAQLREAIADLSWATWIGEVPRNELLPLMRRADVVLSTSRSEGAAPNSLLEATLAGTPVLASDIPAHKEFPGSAFCFRDDRLLRRQLEVILDDSELAAREVRKLQETVRHKHGLVSEQVAWDRLLGALLDPDRQRGEPKPQKLRKSELPKWKRTGPAASPAKPKVLPNDKPESKPAAKSNVGPEPDNEPYTPTPPKPGKGESPWGKGKKS